MALADSGCLNGKPARALKGDGEESKMNALVSAHAEAKRWRCGHDFRPQPTEEKEQPAMHSESVPEPKEKMDQKENRAACPPRKQTAIPADRMVCVVDPAQIP
jgi:hypothetical protein